MNYSKRMSLKSTFFKRRTSSKYCTEIQNENVSYITGNQSKCLTTYFDKFCVLPRDDDVEVPLVRHLAQDPAIAFRFHDDLSLAKAGKIFA